MGVAGVAGVFVAENWPGQVEDRPAFFEPSWLPLEIELVDESCCREGGRSLRVEGDHQVGVPLDDAGLAVSVAER